MPQCLYSLGPLILLCKSAMQALGFLMFKSGVDKSEGIINKYIDSSRIKCIIILLEYNYINKNILVCKVLLSFNLTESFYISIVILINFFVISL